jgi:hypothetical protein
MVLTAEEEETEVLNLIQVTPAEDDGCVIIAIIYCFPIYVCKVAVLDEVWGLGGMFLGRGV